MDRARRVDVTVMRGFVDASKIRWSVHYWTSMTRTERRGLPLRMREGAKWVSDGRQML